MNMPPAATTALLAWRWRIDHNSVGWLVIDVPDSSTNVLSRAVMSELDTALAEVATSGLRGLVIHSAKKGNFIAGADIREFPRITSGAEAATLSARGQATLDRLENLPFPSVAVLDGAALGGGLELAMAATWRIAIASDEPCIGLPEVQLGLHPGFGGTVRVVRLAGVRKGMELMLTGRSISAREAMSAGLIDRLSSPETWQDDAVALLMSGRPSRKRALFDTVATTGPIRGLVARTLREQARRKADPRHYPAPFAMIDLWRAHGGGASRAAYEAESDSFGRLAATETSRNLVRVFFLQDRLKKLAGRRQRPVERVHVVGAGIMGGDIAAWCVLRGLSVTLQDREARYLEPALQRAEKLFERKLAVESARREARQRLTADVAGDGAGSADIVVEAIFENLSAKKELLRVLEARTRPDCVIATNTSSIPIEDLAAGLTEPGRLVGVHFFNPVAKLPLVEVVHTPLTTQATVDAAMGFVRQIGKLPLPCRSSPGFLVNRILAPYLAEAMLMAQEGVPLPEIDAAATDFGMPMGPIELADSVGLDIALNVARTLAPVLGRPVAPELETKVRDGKLGRKTGAGFYAYQEGRPVRPRSGAIAFAPVVQERLVMALLNEAASCLAEEIVGDADLVDAGVIFGTGFAPFRGGPLHYARACGMGAVIKRLGALNENLGPRFAASPGWQRLAAL
jgi:3-hydroxyacyl-CoA dehydrogenase/enoyl-CoA hydratase/3-hydroxybutyryl-CoA epimerase